MPETLASPGFDPPRLELTAPLSRVIASTVKIRCPAKESVMPPLPLDAQDPRELGRFRLLGRLGEGGQGIVYLGEDDLGQRVAVKVLKAGTTPAVRAAMQKEMAAAQQVA